MKTEISALLLCFLVALVNHGLAVDVLQREVFTSSDCSGSAVFAGPVAIANLCGIVQKTKSSRVTCSPKIEGTRYDTTDCSGDAIETDTIENECNALDGTDGFGKFKCESLPDNRVASIALGESCSSDGKIVDQTAHLAAITGSCNRIGSTENSFTLTVEDDDVLRLTTFDDSGKCQGASTNTTTVKVGVCKVVSSVVIGISSFEIAAVIKPAADGVKLGNNAVIDSVNLAVLAIAMIAGLIIVQ